MPSTQKSHELQEPAAQGYPFSVAKLPAGVQFEPGARACFKLPLSVVAIGTHGGGEGKQDCVGVNERLSWARKQPRRLTPHERYLITLFRIRAEVGFPHGAALFVL
jgi:hypothetical protein